MFFTSFLILGQSSLALPDKETDELLRWNGESDDNETARDRDFDGGDRDACVCFDGAGMAGRGILISVYRGLSSSPVFGDASGATKDESSGAAFGVVTAGVEESKSQKGSTCGVTASQCVFPISMVSRRANAVRLELILRRSVLLYYAVMFTGTAAQHSHVRRPPV